MSVQTITPRELAMQRERGHRMDIIDVRTPIEFAEIHVEGSRLVPLDSLDPRALAAERRAANGRPLYVICRSGQRAAKAYHELRAAGIQDIYSVEGGTLGWEKAGLPVVRGRKVISLERQVRIAAGLFVLAGLLLGVLVHPGFLGVSALVGAGLVFAGMTDTCGMGLLLARMPWNQAQECGRSCAS
jgi:rhodanese-related sulfurtransferase